MRRPAPIRRVNTWTRPQAALEPAPSVIFPLNPARPRGAALLLNPRLAADLRRALADAGEPVTAAELLKLAEVERLVLKPGDVLVLKLARNVSVDDMYDFVGRLGNLFPDNKVIMLADDVDLSVVEQSAAPA